LRGAGLWSVPIIDSAAAPHGKDDARGRGGATGVGRGVIVLDADPSGAPIGYHWSEQRTSPRHETAIVMGRLRG
jgi:hypothetical protein